MRCTVPGSTPNCFAMTRTPGLPGVPRASRIRFSSAGANPGIPRDWDLKAPQVAQGDYYRNVLYFPRRRWGIVWWRVGNLKLDGHLGQKFIDHLTGRHRTVTLSPRPATGTRRAGDL